MNELFVNAILTNDFNDLYLELSIENQQEFDKNGFEADFFQELLRKNSELIPGNLLLEYTYVTLIDEQGIELEKIALLENLPGSGFYAIYENENFILIDEISDNDKEIFPSFEKLIATLSDMEDTFTYIDNDENVTKIVF